MKPFLRFLAAIVFLLLIAAGVIYHLGGKQMEFKAETTIQSTTVKNVMDHLSKPELVEKWAAGLEACLLYTSPSPRDRQKSRMPSSA